MNHIDYSGHEFANSCLSSMVRGAKYAVQIAYIINNGTFPLSEPAHLKDPHTHCVHHRSATYLV